MGTWVLLVVLLCSQLVRPLLSGVHVSPPLLSLLEVAVDRFATAGVSHRDRRRSKDIMAPCESTKPLDTGDPDCYQTRWNLMMQYFPMDADLVQWDQKIVQGGSQVEAMWSYADGQMSNNSWTVFGNGTNGLVGEIAGVAGIVDYLEKSAGQSVNVTRSDVEGFANATANDTATLRQNLDSAITGLLNAVQRRADMQEQTNADNLNQMNSRAEGLLQNVADQVFQAQNAMVNRSMEGSQLLGVGLNDSAQSVARMSALVAQQTSQLLPGMALKLGALSDQVQATSSSGLADMDAGIQQYASQSLDRTTSQLGSIKDSVKSVADDSISSSADEWGKSVDSGLLAAKNSVTGVDSMVNTALIEGMETRLKNVSASASGALSDAHDSLSETFGSSQSVQTDMSSQTAAAGASVNAGLSEAVEGVSQSLSGSADESAQSVRSQLSSLVGDRWSVSGKQMGSLVTALGSVQQQSVGERASLQSQLSEDIAKMSGEFGNNNVHVAELLGQLQSGLEQDSGGDSSTQLLQSTHEESVNAVKSRVGNLIQGVDSLLQFSSDGRPLALADSIRNGSAQTQQVLSDLVSAQANAVMGLTADQRSNQSRYLSVANGMVFVLKTLIGGGSNYSSSQFAEYMDARNRSLGAQLSEAASAVADSDEGLEARLAETTVNVPQGVVTPLAESNQGNLVNKQHLLDETSQGWTIGIGKNVNLLNSLQQRLVALGGAAADQGDELDQKRREWDRGGNVDLLNNKSVGEISQNAAIQPSNVLQSVRDEWGRTSDAVVKGVQGSLGSVNEAIRGVGMATAAGRLAELQNDLKQLEQTMTSDQSAVSSDLQGLETASNGTSELGNQISAVRAEAQREIADATQNMNKMNSSFSQQLVSVPESFYRTIGNLSTEIDRMAVELTNTSSSVAYPSMDLGEGQVYRSLDVLRKSSTDGFSTMLGKVRSQGGDNIQASKQWSDSLQGDVMPMMESLTVANTDGDSSDLGVTGNAIAALINGGNNLLDLGMAHSVESMEGTAGEAEFRIGLSSNGRAKEFGAAARQIGITADNVLGWTGNKTLSHASSVEGDISELKNVSAAVVWPSVAQEVQQVMDGLAGSGKYVDNQLGDGSQNTQELTVKTAVAVDAFEGLWDEYAEHMSKQLALLALGDKEFMSQLESSVSGGLEKGAQAIQNVRFNLSSVHSALNQSWSRMDEFEQDFENNVKTVSRAMREMGEAQIPIDVEAEKLAIKGLLGNENEAAESVQQETESLIGKIE